MFTDNYWQNIYAFLNQLEPSQDTFFSEVWGKKRLWFEGGTVQIDEVDLHSAQLACSAQSQQTPILIVLPDELPHRIRLFSTSDAADDG